jgi:UDP-glucuronate decarboxylase
MFPGSYSKIVHRPLPKDDPTRRRPDISLAKRLLEWEPKVSLEEGLEKTIEYFRKELGKSA